MPYDETPTPKGIIMTAMFILTLLVGFFIGTTVIIGAAYLIDSRQERVIMQRAMMVAAYAKEYDVSVGMAYQTLKLMDFVL